MITRVDKNIKLDKMTHEYRLANGPGLRFTSVTTLIGQQFEEFDPVTIATNLVENNIKYLGRTVDELVDEWKQKGVYGTFVHEEIENYINDGVRPTEVRSLAGIKWLEGYKMKSDIEIIPERIIYSRELKIAGTIDVLAYDRVKDYYEIIDWKTSKAVETVPYKGKMGISAHTSNIPDCRFYHYALQLSLYRYILEECYGIKINNQLIAHLKQDGARCYVAPYMRDTIIDIISNNN